MRDIQSMLALDVPIEEREAAIEVLRCRDLVRREDVSRFIALTRKGQREAARMEEIYGQTPYFPPK